MKIYEQPQTAYQKASWFCDLVLKNENGEPLRLSAGEKIIFGIKRTQADSAYVVKKVLTSSDEINGVYPISLTPEQLSVVPVWYYYDVGVQFTDGSFIKVIPKSLFDIRASITEKELS